MSLPIIGLGAMNLDRFYVVERIVGEGEVGVKESVLSPGGSAANTIYALARLGVRTGFVGAVGDDEEGKELVASLKDVGVDTHGIMVKKGARTGEVVALVDGEGRRALYALPGANDLLHREDIGLGYLAREEFLHLSAFVHDRQFQLQKEIVAGLPSQVKLSLAPGALYAHRRLSELAPLLERTYILFINEQEIEELTGEGLPLGARRCGEIGVGLVVVTLGGRKGLACLIWDGKKENWVPSRAKTAEVKDSTGAGDAFAAGFLWGLLQVKDLEDCALAGEVMASFCLAQLGARSGLPTLAQLQEKLREVRG